MAVEHTKGAGELIDELSPLAGVRVERLTIRDQKTRWGSCSAAGTISLSWRLIKAPPEVFRYVVAHEVAHLREMNHSTRFWALVGQLYPDYATARQTLRKLAADCPHW